MATLALITILAGGLLAQITKEVARSRSVVGLAALQRLWLLAWPKTRQLSLRKRAEFTFIALLALPLLCWASGAEAACSGSGITWNCTAGTTSGQLSSALSSASDGATLTLAPGSYSWSSFVSFDNSKGATLICATVGGCNVAVSGSVLGMNGNLSGDNNHFYRVSGFNFTGGSFMLWFWGPGTMHQLRIDHNAFHMGSGTNWAFFLGENSTIGHFYGVADHNTFDSPGSSGAFNYIGAIDPNPPPSPFGSANNFFFEDNTITVTTMDNAGQGCVDGWGGDAIVYRHNTSTNCLITSHGAPHAGGPSNLELYNNRIILNSQADLGFWDCYRCFHHQGSGEFIAFNNQLTAYSGKSTDAIAMLYYRDSSTLFSAWCDGTQTGQNKMGGVPIRDGNRQPNSTYIGYPCWHQPGRDFAGDSGGPAGGNLKPIYAWNNTWSDTGGQVPFNYEYYGVPNHIVNNRDYYNAPSALAQTSPTSPFNGTTGMGFGTLANRPTTCTTGSETGGGVAYFATDQGPQGTLYRCSATNTWTVHYSPYTYPHPLVSGSTSPPAINSPLTASGRAGTPFSYTVTATNNPTSFNATNLPGWASVNTSTGVISGTPTAAGTSSVTLSATNAAGTGTAILMLTISSLSAPTITSPLAAGGTMGSPFGYTITATNNPKSFNAMILPPGLSVNTATGGISGTPTAVGFSNVTLSATNASGTGTAKLALTINTVPVRPPAITSASTTSGTIGTPFSYTITATNSPTSFNATNLPAWASVSTSTGVVSGTPTAAGTSNVTLSATNAAGTGTAPLTLTISAAAGSLFLASDVPANVNVNDPNSVELGVKFTASTNGNITGFRFYKGSQDTGTHTAHLWSASGTPLASATFTGETASGWQQVALGSPFSIMAGTTYIASYHTNGFYSANGNYFATAHTNGPLTAPDSASSGGNGVYVYDFQGGGFPSNSFNATNYWVDVVFSASAASAHPPTINSASTASGTVGKPFSYTITATNNPTSFNATNLPAWASVSTSTGVISGTPSAAGTSSVSLSATNAAGTGTAPLTLTISAAAGSLFLASDVPANVNFNDPNPVELGVKFTASRSGSITGFRFYKGSQDTGTHTAHLWSASGTPLASATFTGETASGWQQVALASPFSITAGTTYVASYHTNGFYSANGNYFATAHTNGPLTAPDSASSGGNGVYVYDFQGGGFPSNSFNATNYWVDVVLQ